LSLIFLQARHLSSLGTRPGLAAMLMNAETCVSRRHIDEPQLHPFGAIPAVEAQSADGVDGLATSLLERHPKLLSGGAKCDGIDDRTIARTQSCPHVRLADRFGIDQAMRGKCNDRLGVAGAEGTGAGDHRHNVVVRSSGSYRP